MSDSKIISTIRPIIIRSDKDTHFTEGLSSNQFENEDITGLAGVSGVIENIIILADQQLSFEVNFYQSDTFEDDSDYDNDGYLGGITFAAADGKQQNATGAYKYSAQKSSQSFQPITYVDKDAADVADSAAVNGELHVTLVNRDSTSKSAGAAGEVVIIFVVRPEQFIAPEDTA